MLTLRQQSGVMLLEALIGVLLFSVGLIAMMGLQANALATVNETKFRGEAAFIAEQFISDMRNDAAYANTIVPPPITFPDTNNKAYPIAAKDGTSPYTLSQSVYPTSKVNTATLWPTWPNITTTSICEPPERTPKTTFRPIRATTTTPST